MMHTIALIGILLSTAPDSGPPPRDTVDPVASVVRLGSLFTNCSFAAEQSKVTRYANGLEFKEVTTAICTACEDAVVIRSRVEKMGAIGPDGNRAENRTGNSERRWVRNKPRLQANLVEQAPEGWPATIANQDDRPITVVIAHPMRDNEKHVIWEDILVGNFVGELDLVSGITLADMMTEGGSLGFQLENVTWASPDHSSAISYRFVSSDFGATTVTFLRIGTEWLPSQIRIVKSAEHKMVPDGRLGDRNLVGNYKSLNDFSMPAPGLDRLETVYDIAYGDALPISIDCAVTRSFRNEHSTTTTNLIFKSLTTGDITCDDVRKQMLPMPDGTTVRHLDESLKKMAWVMQDGEIIKNIDREALNIGKSAQYSSARTPWTLIVFNVIAVVALFTLYRRYRRYQSQRG